MRKQFRCLPAFLLLLYACQKEPRFVPVDAPPPASANLKDTIKAVVFEELAPASQAPYYDSLVYTFPSSGAVITHYGRNGQVAWQEVLDRDAQERVTHYAVDYNTGYGYRHQHFSYVANDSFPSVIMDSVDDGALIIQKLSRLTTSATSAGTTMVYLEQFNSSSTAYSETYNVTCAFSPFGRLLSAEGSSGGETFREQHFYTPDGLLDSTHTTYTALSFRDSNDLQIRYTTTANPLAGLGKLVYRNLYPFLPFSTGIFGYHLNVSDQPPLLYAPRLPQTDTELAADHSATFAYTYLYQFQGTALKAMSLQVFSAASTPTTSTAAVRIY